MKRILLTLAVCALMAAPAMSNPTGAPDNLSDLSTWPAGSARTTHQYWTFSGDHVGLVGSEYAAVPEEVDNPVPQGALAMIGATSGLRWVGDDENGAFRGEDIRVYIKLDNYEDGTYKIMWFDVGASAAPTNISWAAHDGNVLDFDYSLLPGQGDAEFGLKIVPNPAWEEIHFTIPGRSGAWLDYIHVDTVCIPAPGAIALGSIGVAFVGWLRRRRTL
jgi:hypothetical protein